MIRKNDPDLSFVDAALVIIEKEWKTHWLSKLLGLVEWGPFERQFKKLYAHDIGRPGTRWCCFVVCCWPNGIP